MPALHRFLILILFFTSTLTVLAVQPVFSENVAGNNPKTAIAEALQQRLLPEQIAGRIVNLMRSADYNQVEDILSNLLISKPIDRDGYRLLETVYLLLSYTKQVQILDKWCENSPSSHFPFTIRGMHYYEKARFLDGANQTLLLNEKQRRNFIIYLRRAQADLEKAYNLNPQDPGPSATLTALAIQLKQPRVKMEEWFTRSIDADPSWLGGYRAKLTYLSPWRYGSDQMMAQFAVHCLETQTPGSNTFIVALNWIKLKSDKIGTSLNGIRFLTDPTVYSMLCRGLDRYIDTFPLSPRIDTYRSIKETVLTQPYVSIAAFSESLQQNPEDVALLRGRISTYLANKQFEKAATDLQTLEQLEGPTPFSLVSRAAVLYHSRRDIDAGSRLYDQAIADETSSYRRKYYLLDRAEIYRSYGRNSSAIGDYSAALEEDILFEKAYLGRAKSQYALGELDAALADLMILKSSIRGRLATHARSLINTYMKSEREKLTHRDIPTTAPLQKKPKNQQPPELSETVQNPVNNGNREHLIRGLHRFYQKDYEAARRDFYRMIAANPTEAKAYFMLGVIAEQVDFDHTKARIFYEQAFRFDPAAPDYLLGASRTRYRDRDFTAALHSLSDYLTTFDESKIDKKTTAQLYFLRGLCLEETGLISEAVNDMNKALRFDPQLKAATVFIKDHTAQPRTVKIAIQPVQTISEVQSHSADKEIQQSLETGRRSFKEGDTEQARISFLKAIRLNPEISEAYHQLGRISFEFDHDYPKARLYYTQAIDRDPDNPQYYFDRAAIHYYFRQYDLAVHDFTKVLDLQPNNEQGIYYRGVCNHMLGNIEAARRDFNTLRMGSSSWDIEIDRFRNAWNTEIDQFLNSASQ